MEWNDVDRTKALPFEEYPELIEKLLQELNYLKDDAKSSKRIKKSVKKKKDF